MKVLGKNLSQHHFVNHKFSSDYLTRNYEVRNLQLTTWANEWCPNSFCPHYDFRHLLQWKWLTASLFAAVATRPHDTTEQPQWLYIENEEISWRGNSNIGGRFQWEAGCRIWQVPNTRGTNQQDAGGLWEVWSVSISVWCNRLRFSGSHRDQFSDCDIWAITPCTPVRTFICNCIRAQIVMPMQLTNFMSERHIQ